MNARQASFQVSSHLCKGGKEEGRGWGGAGGGGEGLQGGWKMDVHMLRAPSKDAKRAARSVFAV